MVKLNQIIAVVSGKKTTAQQVLTAAHNHKLKPELLTGLYRSYKPLREDGEAIPPEIKRVQATVPHVIAEVRDALAPLFDVVFTQDVANTVARTDLAIDGVVVLDDVPVTFLLFLEKQVTDLETFISKLPVLDPSESWERDGDIDGYTTRPYETLKSGKTYRTHVAYPPTEQHPAQLTTYTVDETIGVWTNVKKSGAIGARDRNAMLARVQALKEAIKLAREEANGIEVQPKAAGRPILDFVFGPIAK